MYGKRIFPITRWDELLNSRHLLPDYQPSEYLIAGGYMGEIVRLIIEEATEKAGLFRNTLPPSLQSPYHLETETLARIESDTSSSLATSRALLYKRHSFKQEPSYDDVYFIRQVICAVTSRSIAYWTAGVHALTSLLHDTENKAELQDDIDHVSIGCDGSVINKYPGYMDRAQETLDTMITQAGVGQKRVVLERTQDSAVLGAGVAAAMAAQSSSDEGV